MYCSSLQTALSPAASCRRETRHASLKKTEEEAISLGRTQGMTTRFTTLPARTALPSFNTPLRCSLIVPCLLGDMPNMTALVLVRMRKLPCCLAGVTGAFLEAANHANDPALHVANGNRHAWKRTENVAKIAFVELRDSLEA